MQHSATRSTSYGSVYICLCLRPSVTSRCSIKKGVWIGLIFGTKASSDQSHTVSKADSGTYKK